MEPIVHISKNFREAEEYDIFQHVQMSPFERQAVAKKLRERYYGNQVPDVRDSYRQMDPSYLSPDILEFIRLLSAHEVRYLIVGGEAVIYYGHARLTGDVDFFYDRTKDNTRVLFAALKEFWGGKVPGSEEHSEYMKKGAIIQFGCPPNRIDLFNAISGVIFEKAWLNRIQERVAIEDRTYSLFYIGLEDLIRNKRHAKRYKDLEDLKYLLARENKK